MNKIYFKGLVTKSPEGKYKVLASTSVIDRQGDSIDQSGWELENFKANPVMPWAHDYSALPVAKATSVEVTAKGLELEFEFAPAEGNPMAQQVKVLYDEGYLNAVSVGFIPKQRNGNVITQAELLEVSFVPVPANQEALRLAMKSIEGKATLDGDEKGLAVAFMLKAIKEIKEIKGEVADELDAEEQMELKCEKWQEVMEVVYALASVYFDENTPVEDFSKLLTETIGLLQTVAGNDGADDDESKSVAAAMIGEPDEKALMKFLIKSGRTLSKKTLENIDKALAAMKDASSVLEQLKSDSSADEQDAKEVKVVEVKKEEVINEPENIVLSIEDLSQIRAALVSNDKSNELGLRMVNSFLKGRKSQVE